MYIRGLVKYASVKKAILISSGPMKVCPAIGQLILSPSFLGEAIRKCRALCRQCDTKLRFSQAVKVQVSDAWSVGSSPTSAISLIEADLTGPQGIRAYTVSIKFF